MSELTLLGKMGKNLFNLPSPTSDFGRKVHKAGSFIGYTISRRRLMNLIKKLEKNPKFQKMSKKERKTAIYNEIGSSNMKRSATTGLAVKAGIGYGLYKGVTGSDGKENE